MTLETRTLEEFESIIREIVEMTLDRAREALEALSRTREAVASSLEPGALGIDEAILCAALEREDPVPPLPTRDDERAIVEFAMNEIRIAISRFEPFKPQT